MVSNEQKEKKGSIMFNAGWMRKFGCENLVVTKLRLWTEVGDCEVCHRC